MRKNNGFVLAELTIAIAIFALCVTIALGYVSRGVEFCGKSRDLSRAMNIARLELAKVENIPFPPTTLDRESDFSVTPAEDSDDTDFQIEVTPTDMGTDTAGNVTLKKIQVDVYRKLDYKKLVTLYTYIARNGLY